MFSQSYELNLKNKTPLWITVSGGKSVLPPIKTAGGYLILHDGNKICKISDDGTTVWQKKVKSLGITSKLFAAQSGLVYFVDSDNDLLVINSSGVTIFKISLPDPVETILTGLDGRFFIFSKQRISCYGLNGICKWTVHTADQSDCTPVILSDGSIVFFLEFLQQTNAQAVRISPFGEEIERFDFNKVPVLSCFDSNRCHLIFNDKTVQTLRTDKINHRMIKSEFYALPDQILCNEDSVLAVDSSDADGIVISDASALYAFYPESQEIYRKISYDLTDLQIDRFYTDGSCFLYCNNFWETKCYRIVQNFNRKQENVSFSYPIESSDLYLADSSKIKITADMLIKGYYGAEEYSFISELTAFTNEYYQFANKRTYLRQEDLPDYLTNLSYIYDAFFQLGLYGSSQFVDTTAKLLQSDIAESFLIQLVRTAGTMGYDPEQKLLSAIKKIIIECAVPVKKHSELLCECCTSLYKISRYMGKDVGVSATEAISLLLNDSYGKAVNEQARKTLGMIAALEIEN